MVEARGADGQPYPASAISNLLASLYHHCHEYRKDPAFGDLNGALQVRQYKLHQSGNGAMVNHAAVVTPDDKDTL